MSIFADGPWLRYRVEGGVSDQQFDELVTSGITLATGWGGWTEMTFGFSCDCGECSEPASVEEGRRAAEAALESVGLRWTYLGEMEDDR